MSPNGGENVVDCSVVFMMSPCVGHNVLQLYHWIGFGFFSVTWCVREVGIKMSAR